MERVSQLILRNLDRMHQGNILLINPPRDSCFNRLAEEGHTVSLFTQDFGDFKWLQESGAGVSFGTLPVPGPDTSHIILIQPREKDRLRMMLPSLDGIDVAVAAARPAPRNYPARYGSTQQVFLGGYGGRFVSWSRIELRPDEGPVIMAGRTHHLPIGSRENRDIRRRVYEFLDLEDPGDPATLTPQ
jgi:hypothetical protein